MKYLVILIMFISCVEDENIEPKILSVSPVKAKIGQTITITGSNLNQLKSLYLRHNNLAYGNKNKIINDYEFVFKSNDRIELIIPELFHEDVSVYTKFQGSGVNFNLIGFIPIETYNFFGNKSIKQIKILDEKTGIVLSNGKLYKSTDGFYTWDILYDSDEYISCFYFLDNKNCWISKSSDKNGVTIYSSENGGLDFDLKFKISNLNVGNQITKIGLLSKNFGYFIDGNSKMFVVDNNSIKDIYDYYPKLNSYIPKKSEIENFSLINENLIFILMKQSSKLIKIKNFDISSHVFSSNLSPFHAPQLFKNKGFLQLHNNDLYHTNDEGETWNKLNYNNQQRVFFFNEEKGVSFGEISFGSMWYNNIYETKDGGLSWEKQYDMRNSNAFTSQDFNFGIGLFGDYGGNFFKYIK